MSEKSDLSPDDRVWVLEAQVREQEAQIDGLVKVVTELLAAYTFHSGDLGVLEALRSYAERDRERTVEEDMMSQKDMFFAARGELLDLIYHEAQQSGSLGRSVDPE